MSNYIELSVLEVAEKILTDDRALILDARDAQSYRDGHLDRAMHAHSGLIKHLLNAGHFEKPVLVYCYHGTSSKSLADEFAMAGFTNAYSMRGGYTAWKKRDQLYAAQEYSEPTQSWLSHECFEARALNTTIDGHLTPLMLACEQGKSDIVSELIAAGADVNARDAEGHTAVIFAALAKHDACLIQLLAAGADIDASNADGCTALITAAKKGYLQSVKLLVSRGAEVITFNKLGQSAYDLAANSQIREFLRVFFKQEVAQGG